MDNNMDISPEQMADVANQIRITGEKYNEKIAELFTCIDQMNGCWQGQEYDAMKGKFTLSKPALDELGVLVNETIPKNIKTAVENYNNTQNQIRSMFS